jgi:hypothetical protein
MPDAEHERKTIRYSENNPTQAKLVLDPKNWRWSSARSREPVRESQAVGVIWWLRLAEARTGARVCDPQQPRNAPRRGMV